MGIRVNGNPANKGLITQAEVGERLGITQGRAYQLEQRALKKIRDAILADPELRDVAMEICGTEKVTQAGRRHMTQFKRPQGEL